MVFSRANVFILLLLSVVGAAGEEACLKFYSSSYSLTRVQSAFSVPKLSEPEQIRYDQVLESTRDYEVLAQSALSSYTRRDVQEMFFRVRGSKEYIPVYRNLEFLSDVEFVVTSSLPRDTSIVSNVEFGYANQKKGKARVIGSVLGIQFDNHGYVKKVFLKNKSQMQHFRNHFFGRPFSTEMRQRILDINTRLFSKLAENKKAMAQVEEFEKKRGWPKGTARKLGLVYYSKDVLNLKFWAFIHGYKNQDLADAGWLRAVADSAGRISYKENFEDSIKIPFYDEAHPTKIAAWRTRNLNTGGGGPKYLSWPMDRSLYAGEKLFDEFYNSWNLERARGKPLVLTEGEFKCAIGEMATGVFHLGIPGISLFTQGILDKIVNTQPSEVIVLFDRDPIGKGLTRLDEVTDSQRASYLIAKRIEAAGLKARVGYLPNVYRGNKVGIDDLVISHGGQKYRETLESAVSADEFAETFHLDVLASELSQRVSRITTDIERMDIANVQTAGVIQLSQRHQYEKLKTYLDVLVKAHADYFARVYPDRTSIADMSAHWPIIRLQKGRPLDSITGVEESFPVANTILHMDVVSKNDKSCRDSSCLQIDVPTDTWRSMSRADKYTAVASGLKTIFPRDEYDYISPVRFQGKPFLLAVVRRESRAPIAILNAN